jgi:hypothetical protein
LSEATLRRNNDRDKYTSWRNNPGPTAKFVASCMGMELRKLTFHCFLYKEGIGVPTTMEFRLQRDYDSSRFGTWMETREALSCVLPVAKKKRKISSSSSMTRKGSRFIF